jgi:hypothetical protein
MLRKEGNMAKNKTCKGCAYLLKICKDGKVLGWCCELSDVPTTEDSKACTEFERDEWEEEVKE